MRLPQFTAELSLGQAREHFASSGSWVAHRSWVRAQFLPRGGMGGPWIPSHCYNNPGAPGCPVTPPMVCDESGHCFVPRTNLM